MTLDDARALWPEIKSLSSLASQEFCESYNVTTSTAEICVRDEMSGEVEPIAHILPACAYDDRRLLIKSPKPGDRVFGFAHRQSVNARIRKVCDRAGITYKPSHTCGRSSFANNALDMGLDIRSVMHAGGWRSLAIFLGIYVRPHRNAGRIVAERFGRYEYRTDI